MNSSPRLRALDVLRGIAIMLVLGRHMPSTAELPALVGGPLEGWRFSGWVGVDLFFVLSGFLVSGLLFREYQRYGDVRVGRFLVRRGLKIYPAFYVFLALSVYLIGAIDALRVPALLIVNESLFLQGYAPHLWWHTWSLAVEEHFYFLLSFVVAIIVARAKRATRGPVTDPFRVLVPVSLIVAVGELAVRLSAAARTVNNDATRLFPTHLRLDSLLFGVLLSYWYHFHGARLEAVVRERRRAILVLSAAALAPCLVIPSTSPVMETLGYTLLYLGFGGVLLLAVVAPFRPAPAAVGRVSRERGAIAAGIVAVLAWIGTSSYSIYLWHLPASAWSGALADRIFGGHAGPTLVIASYLVFAIVGGAAMAKLVEMPGLALRDWVVPSRVGLETRGPRPEQQPKVPTLEPPAPSYT